VTFSVDPPPMSVFPADAMAFRSRVAKERGLALRLLRFVRPHWRLVGMSCALIAAINVVALLVPLVVRDAFEAKTMLDLRSAGLHLLVLISVQQTMAFVQRFSMHVAGARVAHDLRMTMIHFLQDQRVSFFNDERAGTLVSRITTDAEAVRDLFRLGVLNALGDMMMLVGIVLMMVLLEWRLALVAFAIAPVIAIITELVRRAARRAHRSIRDLLARLHAYLAEQVDGVVSLQSARAEARSLAEFAVVNEKQRRASLRFASLQSALTASIQLVSSLCIASIFWYVGVHMGPSEVGFGTLVAFIYYVHRFFEPLGMLGSRYTQLQSSLAGAERIFDLLDQAQPDARAEIGHSQGDPRLAFELDRVTFGYRPEAPVLRDLTVRVARGEKVAVVGMTGGGKSTIMSLLLRLHDVRYGSVRVFGTDVRTFSREELRRRFSVVTQDPFLFTGTVASNVAAGEEVIDASRVEASLRAIGGSDLLSRRRGGIHAPVLARGANFSLGERQIIAFARAMYRDAPILLLDEATASIDPVTEHILHNALSKLLAGRTALIIAHRLSTLHVTDRILVLHEGAIAESGTHKELMAAKGIYAKAYDLQKTRETLTQTLTAAVSQRFGSP